MNFQRFALQKATELKLPGNNLKGQRLLELARLKLGRLGQAARGGQELCQAARGPSGVTEWSPPGVG